MTDKQGMLNYIKALELLNDQRDRTGIGKGSSCLYERTANYKGCGWVCVIPGFAPIT